MLDWIALGLLLWLVLALLVAVVIGRAIALAERRRAGRARHVPVGWVEEHLPAAH